MMAAETIERFRSWLRTDGGRKRARYVAASAASVVVGQAVLALLFGVLGQGARLSNLVSFLVAGALSYQLNRRWTWGRAGRSHLAREVAPFWVLAVAGLAASTWAVGAAESAAVRFTDDRGMATVLVMGASLAAYGTLWVVKFLVFDRVLFAPRPR